MLTVELRKVSLLHYSPALVLMIIAVADAGRFADPDLWRHIVVGRAIIASHKINFGDPYTYSVAGRTWHNHSWLAEAISAWFYDTTGVFGLNLMKLACTAGLILALVIGCSDTGASTLVQFVVILVSGVLLEPFLQFRPQLYTYLLFAFVLLLLVRHNFRGKERLWLAVPIMALWANLHGGFVVGIAALGGYSAACIAQDLTGRREWGRGIALSCLTAVCVAATLATPYGIGSWYTVAHSATSAEAQGAITEWRPLLAAMALQWQESHKSLIFYVMVLGLMGSLAASVVAAPQGDDFPLLTIAAITIIGAFVALRNVPLAVIAIAVPLCRHASLALDRLGWRAEKTAEERAGIGNQIVLAALALGLMGASGFFSRRLPATIPYPGGAVAFMDSHSLHGNILNDVNWGDYLLWHAPNSKIFIDGRFETLFPAKFIREYLVFHVGKPAGLHLLDEYPHDFVLMPPQSGAAHLMEPRKDWTLIYRDANAALFAPARSSAARIQGVPFEGKAPRSYFP